jgi:hypothetical protein
LTIERPARSREFFQRAPENKKPPDPGKMENEGIQRTPSKTVRRAGLILLLTEKLAEEVLFSSTMTSTIKPIS